MASKASDPSHEGAITETFSAGKLPADRLERPLDAADPGREVVRHDERPGDIHRTDILPEGGQVVLGQTPWRMPDPSVLARRLSRRRPTTGSTELDALETGGAFAELSGWRAIAVRGDDAAGLAPRSRHGRRRRARCRTEPSLLASHPDRADPGRLPRRRNRRKLIPPPPGGGAARGSRRDPRSIRALLRRRAGRRSRRSAIVAVLGGAAAEDGDDGLVLAPSVLGLGHDVVLPRASPLERLRATPAGTRARRGDRRGHRDMADPPRGRADGGGLRTGRLARRGRARGHDRLHEGVLPGAGVGGEGAEPRSPAPGPAPRSLGRRRSFREQPCSPTEPSSGRSRAPRRRTERMDAIVRIRWDAASGATLDRGRTALPTARIVDSSGHFASATWGFAMTRPTTPSPQWSLRAIPSFPEITGIPGGGTERCGSIVSRASTSTSCPRTPPRPTSGRSAPRATGSIPTSSSRSPRKKPVPLSRSAARAPIREECLSWALKNGERYGVWGGLTEQERRRLSRQVA